MKTPITLLLLLFLSYNCQPTTKQPASAISASQALDTIPEAYSLDGKPLFPVPDAPEKFQRKDSLLTLAREAFERDSNNLQNIIWLGRRTAYLSRFQEAIAIYTRGIEKLPNAPELYRHRGHRYISTRQFNKAIADFERAASLVKDRPIEIELDGIPNKINQPLSTLQFNIWYHWALAHYLKGDLKKAARLYETCMTYSTNPDLLTATADWLYMTYRRLGEEKKAAQLLELIKPDLGIVENESYFNRLLLYKGLKKPEELLNLDNREKETLINTVTQGYGVGNWYLYNGDTARAKDIFQKVIATNHWSAFGYIAAEAELARMK